MSKKQVDLHHDEVEDILGRPPGWLTRNGMVVFFVVLLILVFGAWAFKIPDVKQAKITLTSLKPPADIEARSFGKVENLFVEDNQSVVEGDILAEIENSADISDLLSLKETLEQLDFTNEQMMEISLPANGEANLGAVQNDYALFNKSYREYKEFLTLDYHQRKIDLLEQEYQLYQTHSQKLETRAEILYEELMLSRRQFERDSLLYVQGVVSESDFENTQSVMLQKRSNWQQMVELKSENDIMIAGIKDRILELELKKQEAHTAKFTQLEEAYNRLRAAISQWEKEYLIISPVDGNVTFNKIWSENQNVAVGEKVMTIVPGNAGKMVGKILLPTRGAGEVKSGQKVNIRFENYPYLEYGMVKGIVRNVSKVPQDDVYTVEVELPEGLVTYYGVEIDFHQNMQGNAEIITDHMRLIQRIFNPVRSAVSRQRSL